MSLIDKIIKEAIDVGNILFGQDKDIASLQGKKQEKNTTEENEIYKDLNDFIFNSKKENLLNNIDNLQQIKTKFPRILQPEDNSVYRGTKISVEKFKSLIKQYGFKENGKFYELNKKINYTPQSQPTSWTYDLKIAQKFSFRNETKDNMNIILCSDVDDSFIFNDLFLNLIDTKVKHQKESETISTKNTFKCRVLFTMHDFKQINN